MKRDLRVKTKFKILSRHAEKQYCFQPFQNARSPPWIEILHKLFSQLNFNQKEMSL